MLEEIKKSEFFCDGINVWKIKVKYFEKYKGYKKLGSGPISCMSWNF